jgi:hypothetical protein
MAETWMKHNGIFSRRLRSRITLVFDVGVTKRRREFNYGVHGKYEFMATLTKAVLKLIDRVWIGSFEDVD